MQKQNNEKLNSGHVMNTMYVKFSLQFFNLLIFLCPLALIIHEFGLGDKGNRESTSVKKI